MKKLLAITVFFPALLFAQQKSPGFIAKYHYLKFSPTVMGFSDATDNMPDDNSFHPSLFATIGGKINRYAALGFSCGYFEMKHALNPVIPVGIDLTLTDFKTKKAFPVITAQWYYAHFKEYDSRGSMYSHYSYDITGKYMYNVGAGIAFRALKTKKIFITGGYGRLTCKTNITLSSYPNYRSTKTVNDHQNIIMLSGSLVL